MHTGSEWIIDAYDCPPAALADSALLAAICQKLIADLSLTVVGTPHWHQFPGPAGVTGLYLLSESHLACHTFPEYGFASFNLYCCRPRREWDWAAVLSESLGARRVEIRRISRGSRLDSSDRQHPRQAVTHP